MSAYGTLWASAGEAFSVTNFPEWCACTGYITFGISASFECIGYEDGPARYRLVIRTSYLVYQSNRWSDGSSSEYSGSRVKAIDITSSECEVIGDRTLCGVTDWRGKYISTPLEFTASWATTSLGDYDGDEPDTSDPWGFLPGFTELKNTLLDTSSVTFRITSRDNCLPVVDCDCESNTDGLKILFNFTPFFSYFLFDGDTELQTFSDLGAYYTLFYQPSANDWVITYERNNLSNTELYYRITARIFCEAVPGGVPSPFRWYYSLESECFEWEDGSITKNTKETWVGHFDCEEDPCGTNGRAAGDLYPVGLPRDVVSLGRTTPEGYAACNPFGGITELRIINDAECP